jgi:hypothetical protein
MPERLEQSKLNEAPLPPPVPNPAGTPPRTSFQVGYQPRCLFGFTYATCVVQETDQ